MDKKYISSVVKREARPRSKRLRELGASGSSGSLGSVISGGDTIVASGSAALETDVTSNAAKTGHIDKGQKLPKGMTFTQFVKALLFKPVPATLDGRLSTANDVEYGSAKGSITYTATRNGNGAMTKAYYDNDEKNKLEFSAENNGVQTAVRNLTGNYTQNETYKATVVYAESEDKSIPETTLNNTISVNVRRKWFAGVVNSVPTTSAQVRALGSSGFYTGAKKYEFSIGEWTTMVICIPSGSIDTVIKEGTPGNYLESSGVYKGMSQISVQGANNSMAINYNMYLFVVDTKSDEASFSFKTV